VEQHLEALLAAEPVRRLRSVLPGLGADQPDGISGSDVRQHGGPGACLGSRCQRGQHGQALGRSRGGFSSKIHLKTDFDGLPLAIHLTGGEASDSRQFEILLDIGPDITPRAALTDKGYDAASNRQAARERHICPLIPRRANAKYRPSFFPKTLYKGRARIEQTIGKLKRFKRIALRCEKTAENYAALISFACGLILVKSVHTA
jgi:transposase